MRLLDTRLLGLAGALALLLSLGTLVQTRPAFAAPPVNARNYPHVIGVDGSAGSIREMNVSVNTRAEIIAMTAPAVVEASGIAPTSITVRRIEKVRRAYVQVNGMYCQDKSHADIFVPDGASSAGLTC
jgi:hypothetical protein